MDSKTSSLKSWLRRTRKRISRLDQSLSTLRSVVSDSLRALPPTRAARFLLIGSLCLAMAAICRVVLQAGPVNRWRQRRLRVCARCPLYHPQKRTCGTPGTLFTDELGVSRPMGCWCYLPTAVTVPWKRCWLVVNEYGPGWSSEDFALRIPFSSRTIPIHPPASLLPPC